MEIRQGLVQSSAPGLGKSQKWTHTGWVMSRLRMVLWRKTWGCWWTNNLRWTSNVDLQPRRLTISRAASVNIGQASARRSDFCLLALAKVMTHLFQTFYQFFMFLHLFRVKFQSTEVPATLGACPYPPRLPTTHNCPAWEQISGWHS